jgi:hypothetical protein
VEALSLRALRGPDGGEAYPEQVGGLALFILRPTAPTCLLGSKLS